MAAPDPFEDLGFVGHSDRISRGIVKLLLADSDYSAFFGGRIRRTKPMAREDLAQLDEQVPYLYVYPGLFEPISAVGGVDTIRRFPIVAAYQDNRFAIGDGQSAASLMEFTDHILRQNNTLQFADLFSNKPLVAIYHGFDAVVPGTIETPANGVHSTVQLQLMVARYEYQISPQTGQPYNFTATEY